MAAVSDIGYTVLASPERDPMKTLLAAFLGVALIAGSAAIASADIEIRKGGSSWAKIESNGTIRIGGSSVGKFESDGTVRKGGSSIGKVESNGTIRKGGSSIGKIESGGTLRKSGSSIGKIESGGTIRKGGSSWGSASNCCGSHGGKRAVAAVIVFFSSDFF